MENEKENKNLEENCPTCSAGCEEAGKSQPMENDQTTENDIVGASHYERAESDQSIGIFARQTEAYNKAMAEIIDNDDENAKDNLSDYMDELKEESETLGDYPRPYGKTEDKAGFPAEGDYTPPY